MTLRVLAAIRRAHWKRPISDEDAFARAGKRRRLNKWRKKGADYRMARVVSLINEWGPRFFAFGMRAALARRHDLSKPTMSRYVTTILRRYGIEATRYRPRRQPGAVVSQATLLLHELTVRELREREADSLTAFLQRHRLTDAARLLGRSVRTVKRLRQALGITQRRNKL